MNVDTQRRPVLFEYFGNKGVRNLFKAQTMSVEIEKKFNVAMEEIYQHALEEVGYKATRFLQMLRKRGGLDTAKVLINSDTTSDGYIALLQRQRLDLTVESLILKREWYSLFTDEERAKARARLKIKGN